MWVANYSLKAENKWPDGSVCPVCLFVRTPRISAAQRDGEEAVPVPLCYLVKAWFCAFELILIRSCLRQNVEDNIITFITSAIVHLYGLMHKDNDLMHSNV